MDKSRALKKVLITVLFFLTLGASFYFVRVLLFEEAAILSPLIFFLVFLLLASSFFVFLVLSFLYTPLELSNSNLAINQKEKEKEKEKEKNEEDLLLIEDIKKKDKNEDKEKKSEPKRRSSFLNGWLLLIYFLSSALFYIFFCSFEHQAYLLAGALIFFFFLFITERAIRGEKNALLKFSISRISKKGLGGFLNGFAVLIAILIFLSPKVTGGELTIPRSLFDIAWDGVETSEDGGIIYIPGIESFLDQVVPGLSGDATVDEYLILQFSGMSEDSEFEFDSSYKSQQMFPFPENGIELEIEEELEEELRKRIEEEREKLGEEVLKQGREQFSEMVGREVKGDEKIKDILYEVASNEVSEAVKPWERIGSIGLILIFFISLKTVLMIFSYIFIPVIWLMFKMFKIAKFFKIKLIKVEKEVISI